MKSLTELLREREDFDFEAKAAQGRDGQGEVPRALWESYAAMANTEGGLLLLGAEEDRTGELKAVGLKNVERVRKTLWDNLNNRQIVSVNLLRDQDVAEAEQDGTRLLAIQVPRASRSQRPVYVGPNPFAGTYRRNYEGDYKCDEETVRRMIAEAVEDVRDARILPGFGMDDLDSECLAAYRNEMRSASPGHPFLSADDPEFLKNIGGRGRDRVTGAEGRTLAGLLMFGRLPAILDAVPHYVVDYQEQPMPPSEQRWLDRVTTDGTWAGNLFDFYRRVYRKLTADLKIAFRLEQGRKRIDESHAHEALREALVNAMIHADFTDRIPILIVKRQDYFSFRNPGGLRLPIETVLRGGESDCRNRRLQKMFQLIGAAEQAGSGFPKILRAWREQHWRYPLLDEKFQPEQTLLRLPLTSLLPPEALDELDARFGVKFRELGETERLAVVTALVEKSVTNQCLRTITASHASDLTAIFKSLVNSGFLVPDGFGRGTSYRLPGQENETSKSDPPSPSASNETLAIPQHLQGGPQHLTGSPQHSERSPQHSAGDPQHYERLAAIAAPVKALSRAPKETVRNVILELCRDNYLSIRTLAELLGRNQNTLQNHYVNPMVREGLLEYQYPDNISHFNQAYRAVKKDEHERKQTT